MGAAVAPKVDSSLILPRTKSGVDNTWIHQKIGLIGPAGIGKSELMSPGEKTLYLQLEAGLGHLDVMKVPCHTWADLQGVYAALAADEQAGRWLYDTIVFDTIDKVVSLAEEQTLEQARQRFSKHKAGIHTIYDYPAASDRGNAGWGIRAEFVSKLLDKFEVFPAAIVFIGHRDQREIVTTTEKYVKDTVSIGGQIGRNLVHWVDHLLNIEAAEREERIERVVRTVPRKAVDAKSRGSVIPDGWVLESPARDASVEERMKAAAANYTKLRGYFS